MAKKTVYNCAYLRVDLIEPYPADRKHWLREAEEVLKSIKRHCDVESVTIEADAEYVCGFCGYNWGEESDSYNGGCCNEDQQNDPTQEETL